MAEQEITQVKYCIGCFYCLPIDLFWRNKRGKDGRRARCRYCSNVQQRIIKARRKAGVIKKGEDGLRGDGDAVLKQMRQEDRKRTEPCPYCGSKVTEWNWPRLICKDYQNQPGII